MGSDKGRKRPGKRKQLQIPGLRKGKKATGKRKQLQIPGLRKRVEDDPDFLSYALRVKLGPPKKATVKQMLDIVFGMAEEMCGAKHPGVIEDWREWVAYMREGLGAAILAKDGMLKIRF